MLLTAHLKEHRLKHKILIVLALAIQTGQAQDEWPEFRGPTGQGHSMATNLPTEWSTTKNITWKQAIPGFGWSSPIVSQGQVFLTSGIPDNNGGPSLHALCLDAKSGKILWDKEVFTPNETRLRPIHDKNSQASPTPIIAGDRLWVHFGHHGTACLDRQGKILWRNNELNYEPVHGNGGSPILADDKLVFHADGASEPFAAALDKNSGKLIWKVARNTQAGSKFSFSTPLLITVNGQQQIISPHSGAVSALDPKDGREIWRVRYGQGYSVVPRPIFGHGLLFLATGFNRADILAIRPDGQGDVTETHIAWRTTKGAPLTPSLLLVGEELYAVSDNGLASCWDAKTGKVHWQEKVDGNYSASPIAAAGRIYLQNETGTGTVVQQGQEFKKLATNSLEERSLASYGISDNAIFIRTVGHLYKVSEQVTK
jgi:outer membrane protein assembly factor BamB